MRTSAVATIRNLLVGSLLWAVLAGCALLQPKGEVVPPPPPTDQESQPPTEVPPLAPTEKPETGGGGAGTAGPGEILFVRQGQIWAIASDGSDERALSPTGFDSVIYDLALSPDGRYLAFTINAAEVDVLDLQQGTMDTIDSAAGQGRVSALAWMPDSAALLYHKLTLDPTTSIPATSSVLRSAIPVSGAPETILESDLASGPVVYPEFALSDQLVVQEQSPGAGDLGQWFLRTFADGSQIPLQDGFSVLDFSPNHQQILLFRQADFAAAPGGSVPIYSAEFSPTEGALNPVQISPVGETAVYSTARFSPDGSEILALRQDVSAPDQPVQLALVTQISSGNYIVTPLALPEGRGVVGFNWRGNDSAVLELVAVEGGESELWVLSLREGGTAVQITTGGFPLVINTP